MKEWKDFSGRLTVWLSDNGNDFEVFARQMISHFGQPAERVDSLDQRYWDFYANGLTFVLHADTFSGVSIHVEDGTHDEELRAIGEWLMKGSQGQNPSLQPMRNPRG